MFNKKAKKDRTNKDGNIQIPTPVKVVQPEEVTPGTLVKVVQPKVFQPKVTPSTHTEETKTPVKDVKPTSINQCPSKEYTDEQIKKECKTDFRKLSLILHPDRNRGCKKDATEKFQTCESAR